MPQIQLDLDEDEMMTVELHKASKRFKRKSDAIKDIIMQTDVEGELQRAYDEMENEYEDDDWDSL